MEKITTYTGHQYIDAIARTNGPLAGLSPEVVARVLDEIEGRIENFIDDIIDDIIEQFGEPARVETAAVTPCPACGQTADALDRRTVAAFSTVTVCGDCFKVVG